MEAGGSSFWGGVQQLDAAVVWEAPVLLRGEEEGRLGLARRGRGHAGCPAEDPARPNVLQRCAGGGVRVACVDGRWNER